MSAASAGGQPNPTRSPACAQGTSATTVRHARGRSCLNFVVANGGTLTFVAGPRVSPVRQART